MSIQVNDHIPEATVYVMGDKGPEAITTGEIFNGKKVVLFSIPGAFTPTCSAAHLPSYVVNADAIKDKGVDKIVCMAVNDAFVMDAWGKSQNADAIMMLADGSAELTKALGLELDLTARGLGLRSDRFAMIVDDGVVTHLNREAPGEYKVSSAEAILELL